MEELLRFAGQRACVSLRHERPKFAPLVCRHALELLQLLAHTLVSSRGNTCCCRAACAANLARTGCGEGDIPELKLAPIRDRVVGDTVVDLLVVSEKLIGRQPWSAFMRREPMQPPRPGAALMTIDFQLHPFCSAQLLSANY